MVATPSRRAAAARVLNPLLAQPMVELCLSIPTYRLVELARDRSLARQAFAAKVPLAVIARRSKGSLQAVYGRAVGDSLAVLRPWLLEGELVHAGLIDRDQLEPLLHRELLIQRDLSVSLLHAAAMEGWVRAWCARLARQTARPPGR